MGEPVIDKRTNNAFIGTDLMDVLDELQARSLVVTGVLLKIPLMRRFEWLPISVSR